MQKNCKFLLSFTLWPLIWPLQPSSAFFNFFEILVTYEVQWYAKMFHLSGITSRKISEWDLAFWPTVLCWSPLDFVLSMFDDFWQLLIFKFWKRRHAHCPTKPWKFYLLFVVWFEKSGKIWKFYLAKYDQTERIHAI